MLRSIVTFVAGLALGIVFLAVTPVRAQQATSKPPMTHAVQYRLFTVDKGRLDDFVRVWREKIVPLRLKLGYRIPFAAKIPETNQFVWLLTYDGPKTWDQVGKDYAAARLGVKPDPLDWMPLGEVHLVEPVVEVAKVPTPPGKTHAVYFRLFSVDKGRLDDFVRVWREKIIPLRQKLGYRIPFAAKIPETNQFVWLMTYDGPKTWEQVGKDYSAARLGIKPDPLDWVPRLQGYLVQPVIEIGAKEQ